MFMYVGTCGFAVLHSTSKIVLQGRTLFLLFYPEISVNSRNPAARISVLPESSVSPEYLPPEPTYSFHNRYTHAFYNCEVSRWHTAGVFKVSTVEDQQLFLFFYLGDNLAQIFGALLNRGCTQQIYICQIPYESYWWSVFKFQFWLQKHILNIAGFNAHNILVCAPRQMTRDNLKLVLKF